jgi:hypothetical protein
MIANELRQHIEHLRLDADHVVAEPQFKALGVQHEPFETPHATGRGRRRFGR